MKMRLRSLLLQSWRTRNMTIVRPNRRPGSVQVYGESVPERLARAKGYPYPRPQCSYLFVTSEAGTAWHEVAAPSWPATAWDGGAAAIHGDALLDLPLGPARPIHDTAPSSPSRTGGDGPEAAPLRDALREAYGLDAAALLAHGSSGGSSGGGAWTLAPILAIGSNAAPEQLARKFPPALFPEGAAVPVVRCALQDFDVVFAPLVSSYGSCVATLEPSAGTVAEVFVTLLTPPLQQRMHETEGAYDLLALRGVRLAVGASVHEAAGAGASRAAARATTVYSYNHSLGTLHLPLCEGGCGSEGTSSGSEEGRRAAASPVALAEIPAARRSFPALRQLEMQAALYHAFQGGNGGSNSSSGGSGGSGSASDAEQQGASLQPVSLQLAAATAAAASSSSSLSGPSSYDGDDDNGKGTVRNVSNSSSSDGDGGGILASDLDAFILDNLTRPEVRAARVNALAACARPFVHECAEKLLTLGALDAPHV